MIQTLVLGLPGHFPKGFGLVPSHQPHLLVRAHNIKYTA